MDGLAGYASDDSEDSRDIAGSGQNSQVNCEYLNRTNISQSSGKISYEEKSRIRQFFVLSSLIF